MAFLRSILSRVLHQVSFHLSKKGELSFYQSSFDIEESQGRVLKNILKQVEGSENAKKHSLTKNSSLKELQDQVPVTDYDYWSTMIEQQQKNNENLLTHSDCLRYQPTSG